MASFSKKLRAVVDPIGSTVWRYAGKRSKHIHKWDKQIHSYGYHKKHWLKAIGMDKPKTSASSFYATDIYGSSGSIIGRY